MDSELLIRCGRCRKTVMTVRITDERDVVYNDPESITVCSSCRKNINPTVIFHDTDISKIRMEI